MISRSKVLIAAAVAVPMALGGVGTAYAAHYQDRALPGSALGGTSVSGMTRDQVAAAVRRAADDVTVTVTAGDVTRTAHLADLGWTVDVDATVDAVFAANSRWSSYATSLVSARDVDAVVSVDDAKVGSVTAGLVESADKVGRDATVTLGADKRSFVVDPAVVGQRVVPASFQDVVAAAARDLTSATTTVEFVDTRPAVTTAEARAVAKRANRIVGTDVVVSDGDADHTASAARKASWVSVPVGDGTLGRPVVDADAVRAWVEHLAEEANTEPVTGLRYVDAAGTVRRTATEAVDGRTATNADALATQAAAALSRAKDFSGDLAYDVVPATWDQKEIAPGAENLAYPAGVGEKWIDVDLTAHTMTAYVGADVVKGPLAMVNGMAEKPTVTGTFHIYYKNPLMTMRGNNPDGTTYETENVPWSSFFYRSFALHGAPWRDSFGYAASHGCVNLPVDVAKWVFDWAPMGTAVVSHT